MEGKLGLKNLTNWNNLFMSLLGSIGASLLAFSLIQMSDVGAYGSITLGIIFILVGTFLSLTQRDECFVQAEDWTDKIEAFICYNRKVVVLIMAIVGAPLIAIGGASLLTSSYWLYTMLAGLALLALSGLFILKVPENLDGRFRRKKMKQKKMPSKDCPNCGAEVPKMSKFCPECGSDMSGRPKSPPPQDFEEDAGPGPGADIYPVPPSESGWDEPDGGPMPPQFEE